MFALFRRCRNAAAHAYRKVLPPPPAATRPYPAVSPPPAAALARPNAAPAWASQPTVAFPRPGRAGWLTPAQTWRANGGRW
ncbi:hypothetical protein [Micromonospora sp. NPDC006431]|uniref:hypothetical protein n=1 Tax=Micromonospora sp. NPDC006431 TaxID=3364235 RepID=UPI0036D0FACE